MPISSVLSAPSRLALKPTIYLGPFAHCLSLNKLEICENGAIGVNSTGRIEFIHRQEATIEELNMKFPSFFKKGNEHGGIALYKAEKRNRKLRLFFPGLIDTHIHASQCPNSGLFGSSTLLDWLNTYTFPTEWSFAKTPMAKKIYNHIVSRTLSHGTTTASYFATIHVPATNLLSEICFAKGQRAFIGKVCMDCNGADYYVEQSVEDSIRDTKETIAHVKKIDPNYELVSPIVTPRFAVSCTKELLAQLGQLAKEEGLPIQTHLDENEDEMAFVQMSFPWSTSYTDVYDKTGILTDRTVLAHAVHINDKELRVLKERGSKISHCPVSNSALGSGLAKVRNMLEHGVEVGLGTDVSGGYSFSVLEAARQAVLVSKLVAQSEKETKFKLGVHEVLYLATLGGAKVMGLGDLVGNFEVGKEWDAICVELPLAGGWDEGMENAYMGNEMVRNGNVDIFEHETSWEDRIAKWLFLGDDRNNEAVWVKGRMVHVKEPVKPEMN